MLESFLVNVVDFARFWIQEILDMKPAQPGLHELILLENFVRRESHCDEIASVENQNHRVIVNL